jgi:hypothetical protein
VVTRNSLKNNFGQEMKCTDKLTTLARRIELLGASADTVRGSTSATDLRTPQRRSGRGPNYQAVRRRSSR